MINEGGYRWSERSACLASLSPSLAGDLELAWAGVVQYWQAGGGEVDFRVEVVGLRLTREHRCGAGFRRRSADVGTGAPAPF